MHTTPMCYTISIDQGTHASRALLFDAQGQVKEKAEAPVSLQNLGHGFVEQDAMEILQSVRSVIAQILKNKPPGKTIAALATQRSTLVAWDRVTGIPLAPAISWQDRRCQSVLELMRAHADDIRSITGLPVSPHYLAGKMRWLIQNEARIQNALQAQVLACGPLASFLTYHLLKNNPLWVDHSNAARSQLFDIKNLDWSPALLKLFDIPRQILPACKPTLFDFGCLTNTDTRLMCVCGDQNAAVHFLGEQKENEILVNIGSGAFVVRAVGIVPIKHQRLLQGIASSTSDHARYILEGTVNGAGSALNTIVHSNDEHDRSKKLRYWLSKDQQSTVFINGIGGLGSPWWVHHMPSEFIPQTSDLAERAVAVVESIVFLLQHNLDELDPQAQCSLIASGGLSRLDGLCQRLADLSTRSVTRYIDPEATARGAAWLAQQDRQHWRHPVPEQVFNPRSNPALSRRFQLFTQQLKERIATSGTAGNKHD